MQWKHLEYFQYFPNRCKVMTGDVPPKVIVEIQNLEFRFEERFKRVSEWWFEKVSSVVDLGSSLFIESRENI